MHYLAPGLRQATTAFAHVVAATLAIAAPFALAEDGSAAGAASLVTPSLRHGLQPVGVSHPLPLTSSPATGNTTVSLVKIGLTDIYKELESMPYQIIPAVCALFFGLVAVFNGEHALRILLVISIGVLVGILAKSNATIAWYGGNLVVTRAWWEVHIVGVEAGLFAGFVTYKSYEGVILVTAGTVGIFTAVKVESVLSAWFSEGGDFRLTLGHWWTIVFYSFFAALFVKVFWSEHRRRPLGLLMPILGGPFVVSALFYMTTDLATNGPDALKTYIFSGGPEAVMGKWIEFFNLLWAHPKKDVGLFADKHIRMMGSTYPLDCIFYLVLWFILFVAGACVQWRQISKRSEASQTSPSTSGQPGMKAPDKSAGVFQSFFEVYATTKPKELKDDMTTPLLERPAPRGTS